MENILTGVEALELLAIGGKVKRTNCASVYKIKDGELIYKNKDGEVKKSTIDMTKFLSYEYVEVEPKAAFEVGDKVSLKKPIGNTFTVKDREYDYDNKRYIYWVENGDTLGRVTKNQIVKAV